MKPLNLDNSPCSPISSNCVIWQGPSIPCIKLCTGDTVSDVVFKLATELCDILDQLDVSNYDLACLNLPCPPENFQTLIQVLINEICDLQNVPVPPPSPDGNGCPTDCPIEVDTECFPGQGIDNLYNFIKRMAERICELIGDISTLQDQVTNLDIRVTVLENAPTPTFTIPSFTLQCDIGTVIPVLAAGSSQQIDTVLRRFINEEWCPYKVVLDTTTALSAAILSQCVDGTDTSLQFQYSSPGTQMQIAYPSYVATPTTLADAINNLWIALCDAREAGQKETIVTAGTDIVVSTTTTISGNNEVTTYEVAVAPTVGIPIGTVVPWAGTGPLAPAGWVFCDGNTYSGLVTSPYYNLFLVIGSTYGGGPGAFNVPDLESRIPVGQGANSGGYDLTTLGNTGGSRTQTLTDAQIPPHTHGLAAATVGGTITAPVTATVTGTTSGTTDGAYANLTTATNDGSTPADDGRIRIAADNNLSTNDHRQQNTHSHTFTGTITGTATGTATGPFTGTIGGDTDDGSPALQGQAHGNMQPYLVMRYIIKYQ